MIRTVLGDITPEQLGAVDYHEHLFQTSPLLPGDDLDDEPASAAEAALLRSSGFDAMIEATPLGLGGRPEVLARISTTTGLHIVATTGRHRQEHYPDGHPAHAWSEEALAARFAADVAEGMRPGDADDVDPGSRDIARAPDGAAVRAGLLKGGIGYWRISSFERRTLDALASAHARTDAPLMIHLEFCTAAHEVLDLLASGGVAPSRVVLAHADRDPDPGLHADLAARGAFLGYDGIARPRGRSDAELLELTARLVESGAGDRLLIGGDVARRSRYLAYGGMPGLSHLGDRYVPRLRKRIGDEAVDRILRANPARLLDRGR